MPEIASSRSISGFAQAVIAVSNDDEVNILAALLAKRAGCRTAISLVNNSSYGPLMGSLGVDVAVSPRESTVSTILQRIRRGYILDGSFDPRRRRRESSRPRLRGTSLMVGRPLIETKLPAGTIVGAVLRDVMRSCHSARADGDPRSMTGSWCLAAMARAVKKIEQMFAKEPVSSSDRRPVCPASPM